MHADIWKKAEELFIQCVDMDAPERARYLDGACAGDDELRAAVNGLLAGDQKEDALGGALSRVADALSQSRHDRWTDVRIGAYTIESRIAEGGMGAVFLANRSDDQFEQKVAVKLLPGTIANTELRARFIGERQILANLSHPNIAKLLDGGETEDGVPYLVMEYIDGVPIDEFCNTHALGIRQRLELFMRVCAAVHYAHSNLIIHRDIKPSNILVTADGTPRLLDFGIAKLLDTRDLPNAAALTMDGSRLLTPRHASPEQIAGGAITTASDVYSLGLLLYEMLCGRYPYRIDDTTRIQDLENTITTEIPQAPSARLAGIEDADAVSRDRGSTIVELRKTLRDDLDTIVLKALRKEPEARYRTAQEFADDLRRYLERRPIVARPPTTAYLLSRYWMRHRAAATGLFATLIAILVGSGAATVGFVKARESERIAVAEARNSVAISDFLVSLFQEANPNNSAGKARSVHEILDIGLQRIDSELEDAPINKASVLETLSSVYKALAEYPTASDLLSRAISYQETGAPDDLAARARMLNDLGDLQRIQSRHDEAARFIERALALHRQLDTGPTDDHADTLNNLALVYEESGRADEAGALFEDTLRMRQALFDPPHPKIALSFHNLAWHHERQGNNLQAIQYALQGIDMRVQVFGEVHPRVASTVRLLSSLHHEAGQLTEAEEAARRAVTIAQQIFETGHPDLSFPMYRLARILHAKGELLEAEALFEQIVAWERVSLGPDSHDLGMSMRAWAGALVDLGRLQQAEALLRESHDILARLPAGSHHALEGTRTMLGGLLTRTGRLDEARALLAIDEDITESGASGDVSTARRLALGRLHLAQSDLVTAARIADALVTDAAAGADRDLPRALQFQADVMLADGRERDAIQAQEQALDIYIEHWGEEYWRAGLAKAELGDLYIQDGKPEVARRYLEQALPIIRNSLGTEHAEVARIAQQLSTL